MLKNWHHIYFFSLFLKIIAGSYDSLHIEKRFTLYAIKHIKSVPNNDKNHCYYNIFLEHCPYQLIKKHLQTFFIL